MTLGSAKVRKCESAKVRFASAAMMVLVAVFASAGTARAQLPGAPLAVEHGVGGGGGARYRDPPGNREGR